MGTFQIEGRRAVGGVHRVPGNKNAALPMIAAALLSEEAVTLENVPDIADVRLMFEFAACFGAKVARDLRAHTATITAKRLKNVRRLRARGPCASRRPAATASATAGSTPTSRVSRRSVRK